MTYQEIWHSEILMFDLSITDKWMHSNPGWCLVTKTDITSSRSVIKPIANMFADSLNSSCQNSINSSVSANSSSRKLRQVESLCPPAPIVRGRMHKAALTPASLSLPSGFFCLVLHLWQQRPPVYKREPICVSAAHLEYKFHKKRAKDNRHCCS